MRKSVFLATLLAILLIAGQASAANLFAVIQDDNDLVALDSNGAWTGERESYEVATTNDTVTTAESGKTFFINNGSAVVTMTLPTAAPGLEYTFTAINGHATSGYAKFILNPQSTDTFVGCVNSSVTTTFTTGDDLDSPGATGDSVRIVCPSANTWVCTDRIGTFVDGN